MPVSQRPPTCFIGSSTEGLPYAKALAHHLDKAGIATEQWDLSTFAIGQTTMEALEAALARCSFAAFVATADDKTTWRGKSKISPRDNIVFEFGLFAGRLTRERAFLLVPDDVPNLKLPSDLLGVAVGTFKTRKTDKGRRSGMAAAAGDVVQAIERVGSLEVPWDPALANELLSSVSRQLATLADHATIRIGDSQREAWVQTVLTGALDPFLVRADDAYAVWLVPGDDNRLGVTARTNLPTDYDHYRWARAEGLAGRVWDTGSSAATSRLQQHEWFVPRPDCLNLAYVCAVVGRPAGPGGVLAVGSDKGFDIYHGDEGLVEAYAAMLSLVIPEGPSLPRGLGEVLLAVRDGTIGKVLGR